MTPPLNVTVEYAANACREDEPFLFLRDGFVVRPGGEGALCPGLFCVVGDCSRVGAHRHRRLRDRRGGGAVFAISTLDFLGFGVLALAAAWTQRSPGRRIYEACVRAVRDWSVRSDPTWSSSDLLGVGALMASFLFSAGQASMIWGDLTWFVLVLLAPDPVLWAVGGLLLAQHRGPTHVGRVLYATTVLGFALMAYAFARVVTNVVDGDEPIVAELGLAFSSLSPLAVGAACVLAMWPRRQAAIGGGNKAVGP